MPQFVFAAFFYCILMKNTQIIRDHRFEEVVHQVSEDLGFWPQDVVSSNVSTLNELLESRAATIVCGEPGSGKSTIIKIVEATRNFVKSEEDALIPDDGDEPPVFDAPTKVVVLPVNALRYDEMFGAAAVDADASGNDPGYLSKVTTDRFLTCSYIYIQALMTLF
jgi:hypothetical protein